MNDETEITSHPMTFEACTPEEAEAVCDELAERLEEVASKMASMLVVMPHANGESPKVVLGAAASNTFMMSPSETVFLLTAALVNAAETMKRLGIPSLAHTFAEAAAITGKAVGLNVISTYKETKLN